MMIALLKFVVMFVFVLTLSIACLATAIGLLCILIVKLSKTRSTDQFDIECPHCHSHNANIVWSASQSTYMFMACKCLECKQRFDVIHDVSTTQTSEPCLHNNLELHTSNELQQSLQH